MHIILHLVKLPVVFLSSVSHSPIPSSGALHVVPQLASLRGPRPAQHGATRHGCSVAEEPCWADGRAPTWRGAALAARSRPPRQAPPRPVPAAPPPPTGHDTRHHLGACIAIATLSVAAMLVASSVVRARRRQLLLLAAAQVFLAAAAAERIAPRRRPRRRTHRSAGFDEDTFWAVEDRLNSFQRAHRLPRRLFLQVGRVHTREPRSPPHSHPAFDPHHQPTTVELSSAIGGRHRQPKVSTSAPEGAL